MPRQPLSTGLCSLWIEGKEGGRGRWGGRRIFLFSRFLNAENEMKKIFGSRVVRAEAG